MITGAGLLYGTVSSFAEIFVLRCVIIPWYRLWEYAVMCRKSCKCALFYTKKLA